MFRYTLFRYAFNWNAQGNIQYPKQIFVAQSNKGKTIVNITNNILTMIVKWPTDPPSGNS